MSECPEGDWPSRFGDTPTNSNSRFIATNITTDCATSVQIDARMPPEKQ